MLASNAQVKSNCSVAYEKYHVTMWNNLWDNFWYTEVVYFP